MRRKKGLTNDKKLQLVEHKGIARYKCKECGSEKWVCFSPNAGREWYCWGHRPDATPEQRQRETERRSGAVRRSEVKVKKGLGKFF